MIMEAEKSRPRRTHDIVPVQVRAWKTHSPLQDSRERGFSFYSGLRGFDEAHSHWRSNLFYLVYQFSVNPIQKPAHRHIQK